MSYLQAIVIAVVQGVTELFPVSSLGHSVLVPAWLGGDWQTLVTQSSQATSETSFYLAYIVALHVATALALLWFFREDWRRIIAGFLRSVAPVARTRRLPARDPDAQLAWLIVIATIPVGVTGLALEHVFRTVFAKPLAAAIFLTVNGLSCWRASSCGAPRGAAGAAGGRPGPRAAHREDSRPPPRIRRTARAPARVRQRAHRRCSRSQRCCRASAAPASRWSAGCGGVSTTRTRRASLSCSLRP